MNLKKTLILLLFILNIKSIAQQQDVKVTYKVHPRYGSIENDEKIKSSKIPDLYKGVDDAIKILEYQLDINKNQSHFSLKDILYPDKKVANLAISFAGREIYFSDKDSNSYVKTKYILKEKYLVDFTPQTNWIISSENKVIEGFICYKATVSKTIFLSKDKIKTYDVEAWFCPELPYSFGPKDFLNLPGLILELHDDKVVFLASKIELNVKKNNELTLKKDREIISETEFYNIVAIKSKEYFDEMNKKK